MGSDDSGEMGKTKLSKCEWVIEEKKRKREEKNGR